MKLTVLTDNNTIIDRYYLGEPALSFYMEDGEERILFDTGYSDVFLKNAEKLGIDLNRVTTIVFSHGHNDHTGGLPYFLKRFDMHGKRLVTHPDVFVQREYEGDFVGAPFQKEDVLHSGIGLVERKEPLWLSEHLLYLGEIPRTTSFEANEAIGEIVSRGKRTKDYVMDDTALAYMGEEGLSLITGCSHSGICNILKYAEQCTGRHEVSSVIGGFHLMKNNRQLTETVSFLKQVIHGTLYPCHCVSLYAKHRLMSELPVEEVGAGTVIEFH